MLKTIAQKIESLNTLVGNIFSCCTFALVVLICIDVVMRYFFNFTQIWIVELEKYFFALIFLMGGAYTFMHDKHVRIDLFYDKWKPRKKHFNNLIGHLFLLLPWSIVILVVSWKYAYNSFLMNESSAQPGGLPALYIMKFLIFIASGLLCLQAIAAVIRSVYGILESKPLQHEVEENPKS